MKIAFISESLDISFGGPAQSIPNLVYGLSKFVSDIKIFIVKRKQGHLRNELLKTFDLKYQTYNIDLEYKIDYSGSFGNSLIDFLKEEEGAIVHVNNLWRWAPYKALKIAQGMDRATVFSARGMLLDAAMSKSRFFKFVAWRLVFRSLVNKVDCIHVTSILEANALRSMGLTAPIAIIAHGIREYESVSCNQKNAAKKALNISIERNYILFLSRITEHKGLHILLEAFSNICESLNRFDILIAGDYCDPSYRLKIEKMIVEKNLTNRVKYLGEVSGLNKANAYRAASLFVLPSRSENFGVVIGEALSRGLPVITTHGTPWSVLSEKGIGAWIPRETKHIERQMKYFCSISPEEYSSLQLAICSTISEYSWQDSSKEMFQLYSWLLDRKAEPDFIFS